MDILQLTFTVLGLTFFAIITSIDNAVINAQVLSTMGQKARKWFLGWGLLIAVFLLRGLLPFLIVWASNPSLGWSGALTASFSSGTKTSAAIMASSSILLIGGGIFLVFLFFNWLFKEPKNYGLKGERFFHQQGVWFYAVVSIILSLVVWLALKTNPLMALGAVVGSTLFFIVDGFQENAEREEMKLLNQTKSDISKLFYLEVIDATFSIDGVLGSFAFTLAVPLILIGNGIGAIAVRQVTVGNIERIKKYKYLQNGAMYAMLILGTIMILDSFKINIPEWFSPLITFLIIGFFFMKSRAELPQLPKDKII